MLILERYILFFSFQMMLAVWMWFVMTWFSISQLFFIEKLILFHQQESSEVREVAPKEQDSCIIYKLPALAGFPSNLSCLFNIEAGD